MLLYAACFINDTATNEIYTLSLHDALPIYPSLAKSRLEGFLTGGDITPVPAPNLTDLRTRETLAAGIIDLSETTLRDWIHDPEDLKPGNYMSERAVLYQDGTADLSDEEIDALVGYLLDLR